MAELASNPNVQTLSSQEQVQLAFAQREEALRDLLDPPTVIGDHKYDYSNYDFAQDSGLLDMFYFDPKTGEDGLRHTLEGDMLVAANGAREVAGFHHEPSARHPKTYVDHEYLAGRNKKATRDYRQFPFQPYNAHVVIQGYPKSIFRMDENGQYQEVSVKSSMFPKEYDPLAVMQAARIAFETRDTRQDEAKSKQLIVTEGFAPMLDGEANMKIRLFIDAPSNKIITAFPIAPGRQMMDLDNQSTKQHLGL